MEEYTLDTLDGYGYYWGDEQSCDHAPANTGAIVTVSIETAESCIDLTSDPIDGTVTISTYGCDEFKFDNVDFGLVAALLTKQASR